LFELACGKRPAEEFYDVRKDPAQMHDITGSGPAQDRCRRWLRKPSGGQKRPMARSGILTLI